MIFSKELQKENLNKKVKYENPYYMDLLICEFGNKYKIGVIIDYDGEYFIIKDDLNKEDYVHKDKIKEVLK